MKQFAWFLFQSARRNIPFRWQDGQRFHEDQSIHRSIGTFPFQPYVTTDNVFGLEWIKDMFWLVQLIRIVKKSGNKKRTRAGARAG